MIFKVLFIILLAPAGALITSYVEYKKNYNLYDLLKDKILGLFGKAKADVAAIEKKL